MDILQDKFYAQTDFSVTGLLVMPLLMANPQDQARAILRQPGWTQMRLAETLSVSQSTVHRWLKGSEPEGHHRDSLNELFTKLLDDSGQDLTVALKGHIGAGQIVEAVEGGPEFVIAPPNTSDSTVAARVRGNSMLPYLRDGSLIYWSKLLPPDELINQICVAQTVAGEIFIKILHRGSEPGKWNLVSFNSSIIENVALDWAAKIDWIKPR